MNWVDGQLVGAVVVAQAHYKLFHLSIGFIAKATITVLPGKHQNLRVGGYTEKVLEYPLARACPRCKVICHGTKLTCIVGSYVLRWGQLNSGEGRIVLQNRLTCSLVAKFPQCSVIAWSTWICGAGKERCKWGHRAVCANLWCLMLWCPNASEQSQLHVYVSSADLPLDNLAWCYTENTEKRQNCQNWGGGRLISWFSGKCIDVCKCIM